jgi:preprotein translocase subunit Sec63
VKISLNEIEELKELIKLINSEYKDTLKTYSKVEELDLDHLQNLKEVYYIGKLELSIAEDAFLENK